MSPKLGAIPLKVRRAEGHFRDFKAALGIGPRSTPLLGRRDWRSFALFRPINDTAASECIRDLVVEAYASYEADSRVPREPSASERRQWRSGF
jgi:hypothetical protein